MFMTSMTSIHRGSLSESDMDSDVEPDAGRQSIHFPNLWGRRHPFFNCLDSFPGRVARTACGEGSRFHQRENTRCVMMCPDMAWIRMDLMLPFSPGGLAEEHSTALVSEKTGDVAATEWLGDFSQASCAESRGGCSF